MTSLPQLMIINIAPVTAALRSPSREACQFTSLRLIRQ